VLVIRLLTLTTLFPNRERPRHGIFVANRLRRLCDSGRVAATVVAALPWFPGAYRESAAVAERETVMGIDVVHPRYLNIPGIGMRIQPDSLARSILDELDRRQLSASRFDLVDAHYFYPDGVAAARVAEVLGLPLTISARGSDINLIGDIPFARKRMQDAARRAQALIAVSSALAQRMIALSMPDDRIHVLRNGVDCAMFAPFPRPDARRRVGLANDARWIAGVGNLVPEKGFDLLIRAAAMLDDARVLIVGEGPERGSLESLAHSIAPGRVEFRGSMSQQELRYVYAACDALALPSLREGWPNVLLEAIACGTPVAASAVGGIPEILRAGAPGLLVNERTADAWRIALHDLLTASMDAEGVRRYALAFGWDDIVARQIALYERVVAGGHPGSATESPSAIADTLEAR
jgi:glycosyltransferase involved in cell wall biosynthesis